jgi:hypothetical protein
LLGVAGDGHDHRSFERHLGGSIKCAGIKGKKEINEQVEYGKCCKSGGEGEVDEGGR